MIKAIHFPHPDPSIDTFRIIHGVPEEARLYSFNKDGVESQVAWPSLEIVEKYIESRNNGGEKHPNDKTKFAS